MQSASGDTLDDDLAGVGHTLLYQRLHNTEHVLCIHNLQHKRQIPCI
jgi:hypothetical protein